jgi:N-acyl homoserine lactone hydrolase
MTGDSDPSGVIDRLYVLDAGIAIAPDRSVYTPGHWQGEPVTLSCNAYLIRRRDQWILWDTGIDEALSDEPDGRIIAHNIRGIVTSPISAQLAEIGLVPAEIGTVILSHGHFDHIGNAGLFGHASWYMQRREHDAMFGPDYEKYGYEPSLYQGLRQSGMVLMDGDLDLFGDGSVRVISTPGHTPGHCSLLVRLAETGPVLLSGDVAHDSYNMVHRCVPTMNASRDDTLRSMDRVAAIVREEHASLWINHDTAQSAAIAHAPKYFE